MSIEEMIEGAVRKVVREEMRTLRDELPKAEKRPVPSFLFVDDIAKRCKVEPPTVRSWIQSGHLAASKPGRHYLVTEAQFADFISKQRPTTTAPVDPHDQVNKLLAKVGHSGARHG